MSHSLEKPTNFDQVKQVRLSELNAAQQYNDLSIDVLLTQSGYLTIKSVLKNGYAVLGYPNQELRFTMRTVAATWKCGLAIAIGYLNLNMQAQMLKLKRY